MTTFVDLDVRPILAAGGEPFGKIMETVAALGPDEGLRLLAPFRPVPLFQALGSKGFSYEDRAMGDGDWEVFFYRTGPVEFENGAAKSVGEAECAAMAGAAASMVREPPTACSSASAP